jgi:hypothetical protein
VISEKTLLVGVDTGEKVYDVVILHPASDYRSNFTVGVKKQTEMKSHEEYVNQQERYRQQIFVLQ